MSGERALAPVGIVAKAEIGESSISGFWVRRWMVDVELPPRRHVFRERKRHSIGPAASHLRHQGFACVVGVLDAGDGTEMFRGLIQKGFESGDVRMQLVIGRKSTDAAKGER